MKKMSFLVLVVALCILQACNNSDNKDSVDKATDVNKKNDTTTASDTKKDTMAMPLNGDAAKFAVSASNDGMAEIAMGKLAETNADSKEIKEFGAMLVKDHTKAGDELKNLATSKNITLPATVSNDTQKHIDDLSKKTGKDFDKDYINMMITDHKDAIDKFEDEAKNATDSAFKNFAVKTLPVLYKHLGTAKAIQKSQHY